MALDNYTRSQKIFLTAFIVLLASMFTVTGAMLALVDTGGNAPPTEAASFDGKGLRQLEYMRLKRVLGLVRGLDRAVFGDAEKESLYARVPMLSPRDIDGYMYGNANQPRLLSLLDVWPTWQDQHLWCHLELAQRARAAGIEPPSNVRIGKVLTDLMNEGSQEVDKFDGANLSREFRKRYGEDLADVLPLFREVLMVRDYVDSLLAAEKAGLDALAQIAAGDAEELRAEYARLGIEPFLDRARAEVRRENFNWRAARAVGAFGVATAGFGYDAMEEAFDKERAKSLQGDAKFTFDLLTAYPAELRDAGGVQVDSQRIELFYKAMREQRYQATDADRTNIDERLKQAEQQYSLDNPTLTASWTDEEWKTWREKQRAELEKYRGLFEVRAQIQADFERENAVPAAQAAITRLVARLNDLKKVRERELNAELDVARKQSAVPEGVKAHLEGLRSRLNTMQDQVWFKFTPLASRLGANPDDAALRRLADEVVRELANIDREQLATLKTTAEMATQDLDNQRNNKLAQREEFAAKESKRNKYDEPMTEAEVAAKLREFDLELEAIREKIAIRDAKIGSVKAFIDEFRTLALEFDMAARAIGQEGDVAARAAAMRELLVRAPARLSKLATDRMDSIVAQSEIDQWDARVQLAQADLNARSTSLSKDAADTRNLRLDTMAQEAGMRFIAGGTTETTWADVLNDERFSFLNFVTGAKEFLEEPQNTEGKVSGILAMPGRGYLLLRLRDKTPKHALGRMEAAERVVQLAAMKRARELAVDALREVRRDIVKLGWDAGIAKARQTHGDALQVAQTAWFTDKMDLPGIYSESDSDLLAFSTSPSAGNPDQPFMTRLRGIPVRDGVTEIIPEKQNPDVLLRPENERWAYMLARVMDRRPLDRRMSEDALKPSRWGSAPAEIWRNRHLASSELVRELITPATLLKDRRIVLYKSESPKEETTEGTEGATP